MSNTPLPLRGGTLVFFDLGFALVLSPSEVATLMRAFSEDTHYHKEPDSR